MAAFLITPTQIFLPSISPPWSVQFSATAVNAATLLLFNTGADPSHETSYRENTEVWIGVKKAIMKPFNFPRVVKGKDNRFTSQQIILNPLQYVHKTSLPGK